MTARKNCLWMVSVLYCAFSAQPALAESASKAPLKLSSDIVKEEKSASSAPAASAPAAPASLESIYEAGSKAYKQGDVAGAMTILKPAADAGHGPSQALLGFILDKSLFYDDALTYYRKSADQGNAEGLYGLGVMYSEGSGVKKDLGEARRLIMSAAEKGQKEAVNVIAQAYIKGGLGLDDSARQGPEALLWIKRSADNNDLPAIEALAAAYTSGLYGLTPDPKKAEILTAKANKLRGVTPGKGDKDKKKTK